MKYKKLMWVGVTSAAVLLVSGCSSKNYQASIYIPYEKSVVQISTTGTVKPYETGWVVKGGDIVTCYHGIKRDKQINVRLFKDTDHTTTISYSAKVVHVDKQHDIAVLQLANPPSAWPPTGIPVGKQVKTGEKVRLLGYMLKNKLRMNDGSVTKRNIRGIVNQRYVNGTQVTDGTVRGFRVDVVATSGNTGSPLFNREGKAVGIFEGNADTIAKNNYAVSVAPLSQWDLSKK